jgi:toxin ParE1/3/4
MSRLLLIHEAADFYDMQSPGLGSEFLAELERTMRSLMEFPEAALLIQGRVRRRTIAKFPYAIIYSLRPDEIRILAVAHHKRRPFYWRGR